MFLIQSETDLLNAFRPRERHHVELLPEFRFPLLVRGHRAWTDPHGFRTFLVLSEPNSNRPMGIIFQRDPGGGVPVAQMCDWCHNSGTSNQIGLLTATASSRRRVGVNVCLDLSCADKIEEAAYLQGRHPDEQLRRLNERMVRFAREGLRIDYVPA